MGARQSAAGSNSTAAGEPNTSQPLTSNGVILTQNASNKRSKCKAKVNHNEEEFILHGIDYLPDFEKRSERRKRKSHIPRFLKIDVALWSRSYLRLLDRIGRALPSPLSDRPENDQTISTVHPANNISTCATENPSLPPENPQIIISNECDLASAVHVTPDCFTVAPASDDWQTFDDYPFENLVLSGGGSKGYAYIGSLKALEDCGVLKGIKRIAGSSAGAICSGLLAVGCTPQDIADVFKCDIKWLFHDQPCACFCCIPRVCNKYGIHPARRFYQIYGEHIARKTGNPDITFKQVLDQCGCELCIVVTNLNRMCSEYCNPTSSPDLPIRDAVRMSMSFPVVFRAVKKNLGGATGRECLYADGGILDQYPIYWFDGCQYELNHNTTPRLDDLHDKVNEKTLGLYLVSEKAMDYKIWETLFGLEIPYKPTYLPNTKLARARLRRELCHRKRENKQFSKKEYIEELRASNAAEMWDHYEVLNKSHINISSFGDYFVAAIETLLISQRKRHIKPRDVTRTVAINCGYIGTNDYEIEPGDREFMIRQGYECTRHYLVDFVASHGKTPPTEPSLDAKDMPDPQVIQLNGGVPRCPEHIKAIVESPVRNAGNVADQNSEQNSTGNSANVPGNSPLTYDIPAVPVKNSAGEKNSISEILTHDATTAAEIAECVPILPSVASALGNSETPNNQFPPLPASSKALTPGKANGTMQGNSCSLMLGSSTTVTPVNSNMTSSVDSTMLPQNAIIPWSVAHPSDFCRDCLALNASYQQVLQGFGSNNSLFETRV